MKEKQIDKQAVEEMAEVLEEAKINAHATIGSMNGGFGMWYAEALYNAGYRRQSEWISVEDRLPKDNVPVIVYKNKYSEVYGNMETAYIHNGIWRGSIGEAITHWMPLPEPPKMKGGAE